MAQTKQFKVLKFKDPKSKKIIEFKLDVTPMGPKVKGARYV